MTLRNSLAAWLALLAVLVGTGASLEAGDTEETGIHDFEERTLSSDWTAVGTISATREDIAVEVPPGGPSGKGVRIEAQAQSGLFLRSGRAPGDWRSFRAIHFWVHRGADEAKERPTSVLEFQVYEKDTKARRWRKVEINHTGWKRITLPLRWFRFGGKNVARWDHADRCGFWFRDAATLWIDQIAATRGEDASAAYLSPEDIATTAISGTLRVSRKDPALVLTNAPKLDGNRLAGHLAQVAAAFAQDFPYLPGPARPCVLAVLETREQYEAFSPKLAARMNANASPPKSPGYTIHGIATGFWDDSYGTLRPTYTHEFVHALIAQTARLPADQGNWFHEGLASYYQLRYHPQDDIGAIVRQGLGNAAYRLPLRELVSGGSIPSTRYWQAMTVVEMLMEREAYAPHVRALLAAFLEKGSTALPDLIGPLFKKEWDHFEADWKRHCYTKYPARK